ncbi:hypothetical protein FBY03_101244 [Pseudomonas sp. SJZ079]|uniref:hypothetical protein n=1 Tax=Pseudomonas sp. SJZ079 TaxID=2572887 RepID=UPI00119C0E52|nr:hypothetical protein [Pseudomonas sp. SJZ079]TWC43051.1 hypothetical protein FBY03_101244 [Pseudomonas sp. SJZ079]
MKLKMLGMALAFTLAGCASFPGDQVPETTLPSMASYQQRPSVFVDFTFYQGKAGDTNAVEVPQAKDALKPQLEASLRDSGLFSRYTLDEFQKQPGDYTLKLNVYNSGSAGAAMVSGMISGFTFMVIPATAKDEYTMTLQVMDAQNQPVSTGQNNDSVRTWMGLIFIPMMAYTPEEAINDSFRRQLNALLKQMVDQQVLKYAQGQVPLRG